MFKKVHVTCKGVSDKYMADDDKCRYYLTKFNNVQTRCKFFCPCYYCASKVTDIAAVISPPILKKFLNNMEP